MQPTSLSSLIVTRILRDGHVTLTQLEARAEERGLLLSDLYAALDTVHRDKRIKRGVKGGEVYYMPTPPKATAPDHLAYVRNNYPPMTEENDGSGIEADFDYLFLSPEAMKEYKAAAKGMPTHMVKSRYGTNT